MSNRQNITRIKVVNNILDELSDRVVFVGGATVSLYSDRPSLETRPTDDIDILIELLNYNEFATKLEAFKSRGKNDGRTSTDFEDIVFVLNNRSTIWEELKASNNELKDYLKQEFSHILQIQFVNEWITAHLEFNEQKRGNYILEGLRNFVTN